MRFSVLVRITIRLTSCLGHIAHPFKNGTKQQFITCLTSWFYGKTQIHRSSTCSADAEVMVSRGDQRSHFQNGNRRSCGLTKYPLTNPPVLHTHRQGDAESPPDCKRRDDETRLLAWGGAEPPGAAPRPCGHRPPPRPDRPDRRAPSAAASAPPSVFTPPHWGSNNKS